MTLSFDLWFSVGARSLHTTLVSTATRIAIVGPSGVGKTTLLRAITGTRDGVRGSLTVKGVSLHDEPPEKRRIGWVPQDAVAFPHLSVRENVSFGASGSIERLVEALALTSLLDRAPQSLSGGERQRVAIARALASKPRLLLLDEPLSALDREGRAEVARVIEIERASLEATLLLVSHDEADVAALADEIYVLSDTGALSIR